MPPSDPQCPNPDCPMLLRRTEDTGIQAVLAAIGEVNTRVGRIDDNLLAIAKTVATHDTEITTMKTDAKDSVSKKWVLIAAFIGASPAVIAWIAKVLKSS